MDFNTFSEHNKYCVLCGSQSKTTVLYCSDINISFSLDYNCCDYRYAVSVWDTGIIDDEMSIMIGNDILVYTKNMISILLLGKPVINIKSMQFDDFLYPTAPIITAKGMMDKYIILK